MSKKNRYPSRRKNTATSGGQGIEMFTFGDPVPMLDQREYFDYLECPVMDRWYEPPLSPDGLSRSFRSAIHHSSPVYVKRNILVSTLMPTPMMSTLTFSRFVLEYLIFGNAYLELRRNGLGEPWRLEPVLAKYARRGTDPDTYWFVHPGSDPYPFKKGSVFHLLEPDINQEIYGLPEYLAALNATWLNESATLFRRRYYLNGGHMGFILYLNSALQNNEDVVAVRRAMKDAKGIGNFRNMFLYSPNGNKDGIQVIPLSEIATKDDFAAIKTQTRNDQLSAHRVPPQLMGILPEKDSGFGDVGKAAMVFARNELVPLQARMQEINQWLGDEVIRFMPYTLGEGSGDLPDDVPTLPGL
ncbi:phage portal protein [Salmonella enterica]|nr:phage portal protein [Salmonella enterica subsp. diarizonae]ELB6470228.1 phage portal protein [Salmonella enterica]